MNRIVPTRPIVFAAAFLAFALTAQLNPNWILASANRVDQLPVTVNQPSAPASTTKPDAGSLAPQDGGLTLHEPVLLQPGVFSGTQTAAYCIPSGYQCSSRYRCCSGVCVVASTRAHCL